MKILKNKKTVVLLSITGILAVLTALAIVLFLNSPVKTTELPDFENKTIQDIMSWKDSNELLENQVVYEYEYSEEKEKDTVLSQSLESGTKMKEEDVVTFIVSKGADPDKVIELPQQMSELTETQLKTFFEENKFSDVTFEYVTSSTVKEDYFVSINVKESSAKRSDMIIVQISVGTESVGVEIPMPDFSGNTKKSIESWAETNNITVTFKTAFSDTVESGKVINQSPEKNTTIKTGDTVTITLSSGKAIKVDNLKGKTKTEVEAWVKETGAKVEYFSYYADSTEKDKVISTSPSSGSVSETTKIKVYLSLGSVKLIDFAGKTEKDVKTWVDTINKSIYAKENYIKYKIVQSDKKTDAKSGTILSTSPKKDETVKLADTITITVEPEKSVEVASFAGKTEAEFKKFITDNDLALGTKSEKYSTTIAKDSIISNDTGKKEPKTKINYTVSRGAYSPAANSFNGKTESEVKNVINDANKYDAGWSTAFTQEYSDSVASGKTFGCAVNANTKKVTCKLSIGKGVTVPDYVSTNTKPCESDSCSVNGLKVTMKSEHSSTVAKGSVISQSLTAGSVVKEGSAITVVISKGPADTSVNIASYAGKTEAEFKTGIESAGMILGTRSESYSSSAAGTIISNDTGKKQPGTKINYVVSKGTYSPSADSFNGKTEAEVNNTISTANQAGAGWTTAFTQDYSDSVTSGKTFGCSVDTSAKKVSCIVSKGARPVEPEPEPVTITVTAVHVAGLENCIVTNDANATKNSIISFIMNDRKFTVSPVVEIIVSDEIPGTILDPGNFTEGTFPENTVFTIKISGGPQ